MIGTVIDISKMVLGYVSDRSKVNLERSKQVAKSLHDSWKDEYVTVLVTIPMIIIWIGAIIGSNSLIERMKLGIETLDTLPNWYVVMMVAIIMAAAGLSARRKL